MRVLQILGLFSVERPVLSVQWMTTQLQASRATVYRDIQELVQAGLLEKADARGYALGARIVQMDRQIRLADPLLQAAGRLPHELARATGGTVLLCRLHASTVLCIQETSHGDAAPAVSYERGRAMPLYRGATSKVLLAHLPAARLGELVHEDRYALEEAGLPHTLEGLQQALAPLRAQGHVITHAEVDADAVGIAAPLLDNTRLLGSLSVVMPKDGCTPAVERRVLSLLKSCTRRIEARLQTDRRQGQALRHTAPSYP